MVKIVFIKNPFSPAKDRVIKLSEAENKPLSYYADDFIKQLPDSEAWIEIDGRRIEATYEEAKHELVKPNSFVMVMPKIRKGGGKSILGLVAVIALSVVTMGVGNIIAGGSFFAGGAVWGLTSYIGAAAVMFLGNSLVSRFFTSNVANTNKYASEDPTYSWDGVQTMDSQGNGIAITYGKVKSGGQSIMKFTSNDGNDQYFNWLVAAGEGELEISDVQLNDNPIANYEDVTLDIRNGTNDQDVISNFNDTILSKSLSYEVSNNEWRTDELEGNTTEGIIIEFECSNGLYHAENDGSLSTAWIDVEAQYALQGSSEWTTFVEAGTYAKSNSLGATLSDTTKDAGNYYVYIGQATVTATGEKRCYLRVSNSRNPFSGSGESTIFSYTETGSVTLYGFTFDKATIAAKSRGYYTIEVAASDNRISGAKAGTVRRQFRVDHLPMGAYQVRVTVTNRSADVDSSRDAVRIWWTQLNSVVYDDFCYPGIALLGIKAKATDQLSGSTPTLEFIKERSTVYVWNPDSAAYEEQAANNPAWAAYDFIHGADRLYDINNKTYVYDYKGVPKELMLYDQFKAWADNCDTMNLKINLEITTVQDFWTTVNEDIAPVGRGMVVQFGSKFGCIYDHSSQPVQLFNMGNIIQGSFQMDYLSTEERADSIELTFCNADKDYEQDTLTIYADDYDSLDVPNQPTQLTMNGITSYEQAYREGKYQLYCNRLLTETISFKADVECIGCMVGDVIEVAHDVPQWAISGRVLEADGATVVLPIDPDEITMEAASYGLMIRDSATNALTTYTVTAISGTYGEVTVTCSSEIAANPGDLFSLGKIEAVTKAFTVTGLTRSGDFEYTVSAIEYAEGIFEENYDIPEQDTSLATDSEAVNVINLSAYQIGYKNKSGMQMSRLYVSWALPEGAEADSFTVMISSDVGATWKVVGTTINFSLDVDVNAYTTYYVKVLTNYRLKQSSGTTVGPIAEGIDVLPPNVTQLDVEVLSNGTRRYYWDFEYPEPNDIAGFKFKYIQGSTPNWNTAYEVQDGLVTAQPYETSTVRQGVHTVMIKAVDNAGQESAGFATCIVNFSDPLEDNVLFKTDFSEDSWSACETNGTILSDGYVRSTQDATHWASTGNYYWSNSTANFWGTVSYKEFYLTATVTAPASGNFYVLYEIEGPSNITYRIQTQDNIYKPYATKFKVSAGDVVELKFEAPTGTEETVLKSLIAIIDVPDREEHFEDIEIPAEGLELPIVTPNYYTTAVRVDSISNALSTGTYQVEIVSYTPCKVQVYRINNDAGWSRDAVAVTADITWQGFEKELLE